MCQTKVSDLKRTAPPPPPPHFSYIGLKWTVPPPPPPLFVWGLTLSSPLAEILYTPLRGAPVGVLPQAPTWLSMGLPFLQCMSIKLTSCQQGPDNVTVSIFPSLSFPVKINQMSLLLPSTHLLPVLTLMVFPARHTHCTHCK